jgi:two-component system, OmpR family, sensor histidine kinase VanS
LVSAIRLWEKIGEDKRGEIIEEMEKNIKQIEALLEAVAQTKQAVESGEIVLNNVEKVATQTKAVYRGLEVKINSDLKKALVTTDTPLISVFDNIFSNAISHGQATEIEINIQKENEETLMIEIENNGKKIKEGNEKNIFKKGFKDQKTGGTGMGLFFIKNMVERNQGEIKVVNTEKGVKFIIKFPLFKKI